MSVCVCLFILRTLRWLELVHGVEFSFLIHFDVFFFMGQVRLGAVGYRPRPGKKKGREGKGEGYHVMVGGYVRMILGPCQAES